jgi:hypothetical protein
MEWMHIVKQKFAKNFILISSGCFALKKIMKADATQRNVEEKESVPVNLKNLL